jgi:hypothetical protein
MTMYISYTTRGAKRFGFPNEPISYENGFFDGYHDARLGNLPPWQGRPHPDRHYARGYWDGGQRWRTERNRRAG